MRRTLLLTEGRSPTTRPSPRSRETTKTVPSTPKKERQPSGAEVDISVRGAGRRFASRLFASRHFASRLFASRHFASRLFASRCFASRHQGRKRTFRSFRFPPPPPSCSLEGEGQTHSLLRLLERHPWLHPICLGGRGRLPPSLHLSTSSFPARHQLLYPLSGQE
jgi:hypothetical protein